MQMVERQQHTRGEWLQKIYSDKQSNETGTKKEKCLTNGQLTELLLLTPEEPGFKLQSLKIIEYKSYC